LQETSWHRDISRWARGDVAGELDQAKNVFDWTVRNIQLEADRPGRVPQLPWETLYFGRGTATERAWVCILLLRQLQIDAAMLAVESDATERGLGTSVPGQSGEPKLRPWCVGVLIEDEVYLFDPALGLPIPAADGVTRTADGRLAVEPATLAEVAAHPKLLERLDVDSSRKYGFDAAALKRVVTLLEASPDYLSQRMKLLELSWKPAQPSQGLVLTTSPTEQATRWRAAKPSVSVRLWLQPFETLDRRMRLDRRTALARLAMMVPYCWMHEDRITIRNRDSEDPNPAAEQRTIRAPALGQARVLYLKNKFAGDRGAIHYYQMARPSDQRVMASSISNQEKSILLSGKQDATYGLGLIAYDNGNYDAAIDYFTSRSQPPLISPESAWADGARYNLARAYEASGERQRAVLVYRSNVTAPDRYGQLLRAKWLSELKK
ncbi:MAG: hypothetical protein ABFC96_15360, partial [Thermoguttaceae bacterium]